MEVPSSDAQRCRLAPSDPRILSWTKPWRKEEFWRALLTPGIFSSARISPRLLLTVLSPWIRSVMSVFLLRATGIASMVRAASRRPSDFSASLSNHALASAGGGLLSASLSAGSSDTSRVKVSRRRAVASAMVLGGAGLGLSLVTALICADFWDGVKASLGRGLACKQNLACGVGPGGSVVHEDRDLDAVGQGVRVGAD